MLYGAICDDDMEIHKELSDYFHKFSSKIDLPISLSRFSSGEELLQYYTNDDQQKFHFLFLDVDMKGIDGLETARRIRKLQNKEVIIIFLTSYPEYVMDCFDVHTFQYLLKPLTYLVFETKMKLLYEYLITTPSSHILLIKTENGQTILKLSDIIVIIKIKHSLIQNKLQVITAKQQYVITGTISEYTEKLDSSFLLVFRSVIVNMEYIRGFTANSVVMIDQQEYPISRRQITYVKDIYNRYMVGKYIK